MIENTGHKIRENVSKVRAGKEEVLILAVGRALREGLF